MFQVWSVFKEEKTNKQTKKTDMNLCKLQEMVKDREAWYAVVNGVTKKWTWLNSNYMQKRDRLLSILFHRTNPESVDGITNKYPTSETEIIIF